MTAGTSTAHLFEAPNTMRTVCAVGLVLRHGMLGELRTQPCACCDEPWFPEPGLHWLARRALIRCGGEWCTDCAASALRFGLACGLLVVRGEGAAAAVVPAAPAAAVAASVRSFGPFDTVDGLLQEGDVQTVALSTALQPRAVRALVPALLRSGGLVERQGQLAAAGGGA